MYANDIMLYGMLIMKLIAMIMSVNIICGAIVMSLSPAYSKTLVTANDSKANYYKYENHFK